MKNIDFQSFKLGAMVATMLIVLVLVLFWQFQALPFLHGIAYNMQLDESVLKHFGITPTSNYQLMWDQVSRLVIR